MRGVLFGISMAVAGCAAGPTRSQLADTPTARSRPVPATAPAASSSDDEREHMVQQFDDMKAAQQATHEAKQPKPVPAPLPPDEPPPLPPPAPNLGPPGAR